MLYIGPTSYSVYCAVFHLSESPAENVSIASGGRPCQSEQKTRSIIHLPWRFAASEETACLFYISQCWCPVWLSRPLSNPQRQQKSLCKLWFSKNLYSHILFKMLRLSLFHEGQKLFLRLSSPMISVIDAIKSFVDLINVYILGICRKSFNKTDRSFMRKS